MAGLLPNIRIAGTTRNGVSVVLRTESRGIIEVSELPYLVITMRVGEAVLSSCIRGGRHYYGTTIHGDLNIIPPHTPSRWEIIQGEDRALIAAVPQQLIDAAAEQIDCDPTRVEVRDVFRLRDRQIDRLALANCVAGVIRVDDPDLFLGINEFHPFAWQDIWG